MLVRLLADVLPYDPDREKRIIGVYDRVQADTIDTIRAIGQQVNDGMSSGGSGSHHSLPFILGGILAALVALGFLIFMVRSYRHRSLEASVLQ